MAILLRWEYVETGAWQAVNAVSGTPTVYAVKRGYTPKMGRHWAATHSGQFLRALPTFAQARTYAEKHYKATMKGKYDGKA